MTDCGVLHDDRARAESFGGVADLYDRARPSYPPALVDELLADRPRTVLDVGCGTGIATPCSPPAASTCSGSRSTSGWRRCARPRPQVEVAAFERWDPAGRRSTCSSRRRPGTGSSRRRRRPGRPTRWRRAAAHACSGTLAPRRERVRAARARCMRGSPGARGALDPVRQRPRHGSRRRRGPRREWPLRARAGAALPVDAPLHDGTVARLRQHALRPSGPAPGAARGPARRGRRRAGRARRRFRDAVRDGPRRRPAACRSSGPAATGRPACRSPSGGRTDPRSARAASRAPRSTG